MSSYELTPEMVTRVRQLVKDEIAERFRPPRGQRSWPGGQREIARRLHMSQPALNQCFIKGKKEFGIDVLLGLRAYFAETGRPMTIDQMLGLPGLPQEGSRELETRLSTLETQLAELRGQKRGSHVRQRMG